MTAGFQPGKRGAVLRMASGGAFGFIKGLVSSGPPETVTQKYARQDAERAKANPQPAPAPTPPPTAPAPNTISGYAGMSAMQRREKEAGLKDGGDLKSGQGGHVPGTGSGDKIPAKYEPGEFVVSNAMLEAQPELRDQLHALRTQVLASQGKTPEQADAKNSAAIAQMTGQARQPKGFKPELFFKTGGDDREKNSFGDAAAVAANPAVMQAPTGIQPTPQPKQGGGLYPYNKPTPDIYGQSRSDLASALQGAPGSYAENNQLVGQSIKDSWGKGNYGEAAGQTVAGTVGMLTTPLIDGAVRGSGAAWDGAKGFARGLFGSDTEQAPAPAVPSPAPAVVSPAPAVVSPAPAVTPSGPQQGAKTQNPAASDSQQAGQAPPSGQVRATRQPNGVMSFSGENVGGPVSYAGASSFKPSGAGVTVVPGGSFANGSASGDAALSAARFAAAERGDFDAVRDSYNAQGQSFGGQTKESVAADKLKDVALSAGRGSATAASMYRDQMAANTANKSQEAAQEIAKQKLGLDRQEFGLKQTTAGFASRKAAKLEALHSAYEQAKPEERPAIAEEIRVFNGQDKAPNWQGTAIAGAKNQDGSSNEGGIALWNAQTGELRQAGQGGSAQAKPLPKTAAEAVAGEVYQTARGPMRWDGKLLMPL